MRPAHIRLLRLAAVAALAAQLFAAAPAKADITCNIPEGYKWCGIHWPGGKLPIQVWAKTSTAPGAGISSATFVTAVAGAVAAWDAASGLPPSIDLDGVCPIGTRLLCFKGSTTTGKSNDGKMVVLFGTMTDPEAIGETTWSCEGGSCLPPTRTRLRDADVTLRPTIPNSSWRQASNAELVFGEIGGPFGPFCPAAICPNWYDLQSVITHELGHVLGLDETEGFFAGCEIGQWAEDLTDVINFLQTMYPCQWKGLTNRRTLDVGDIAGLHAVYVGSVTDP